MGSTLVVQRGFQVVSKSCYPLPFVGGQLSSGNYAAHSAFPNRAFLDLVGHHRLLALRSWSSVELGRLDRGDN